MNFRQACWKRSIEAIMIAPFVFFGKCAGFFMPCPSTSRFFLFFPSADLGGAPKVNADLLQILKAENPLVIFSKKAKNNGFRDLFHLPGVHVLDLSKGIDSKWIYFVNIIYRGILSSWINRTPNAVIVGGECMYFYKIVQHVKKGTRVIEVSHLNTWLNFNQAYIPFIDYRMVSTPKLKRYMLEQYQRNQVPEHYATRIRFVDNWVPVPEWKEKTHSGFTVLFVGRGAPQKRVHLISAIAEHFLNDPEVSFTFVGDVQHIISPAVEQKARLFESVQDANQLNALYDSADVLILTSAYEGLPIVVMDMMARGKVVLSTAVDGIPDYIEHQKNGILIHELQQEEKIIAEGVHWIQYLKQNPLVCEHLGQQARALAIERFSKEVFDKGYRCVLGV